MTAAHKDMTRDISYAVAANSRTGRAVSREAGAPWADRLLPLPAFLRPDAKAVALAAEPDDIAAAHRLVGVFLERHVLGPRGLPEPEARRAWMARAAQAAVSVSLSEV